MKLLDLVRERLVRFAVHGRFTEAEVDAELNQLKHEQFWLQAEQQQINQLIAVSHPLEELQQQVTSLPVVYF